MTTEQMRRARDLAQLLQTAAQDLLCAAAGFPDRLERARWKGRLDTEIACLITDIRRPE